MNSYRLLDDFTNEYSTLNNPWEGFTDQVMGGVSDMSVRRITDSDGSYIRMKGQVSLENNGGFIQIRQKLSSGIKSFDGSPYGGLRLKVRGRGSGYYIFLRTTNTLLPWKFYKAPFEVQEGWQTIDIPWSVFVPGDYGNLGKLKINKLKSLALVAYGEEFTAEIDLLEIGFYK